jgi:peptide/nickel transport system permease protein
MSDSSPATLLSPSASSVAYRSTRSAALRRFARHRLACGGAVVLAALVVVALFAPKIAPYDPAYIDLALARTGPSAAHWFGTDTIGRDVLSRLIYASRVSMSVGIVSVAFYLAIGLALGLLAGYYGGFVDGVLMRIGDMVMAFPTLILVMVIVALTGPSIWNIMAVIGLLGWPEVARLVRSIVLILRSQEFVLAARASGVRDVMIIFRHVLPNTTGAAMVAATFGVANAILVEAALSFLGMGVQPPTASWGNMLSDAQSLTALEYMPWLWVPPGLMILVTTLAVNFLGDGLRDALDPRSQLNRGG